MASFQRVLIASAMLVLAACSSVVPYQFPKVAPRTDLIAVDRSEILVKHEFRYSPALTSYVLPAGAYVPVQTDADGTYYESPRGILVVTALGHAHLERGGIFRSGDSMAARAFAVYGDGFSEPLRSTLDLDLKRLIVCRPECSFE